MTVKTEAAMPLPLAIFIFLTLIPGGVYLAMKIWFYFLNTRFRSRSAAIREELGKEATLWENNNLPVFVGFFHPYWYVFAQ